ncbi:hypothetical protein [Aquabacterium sp.]|uniref:hypothetical protein n=1 Tax=Aquabacterium sp. TaxID=1872578 RepID=UPI003D6D68F6
MTCIDRQLLARTAHDILTHDLESYGNVLSEDHSRALASLLDSFAAYLTGELAGRRAFSLPTGMGKTAAIVAFITALEQCGYSVPLSIAASNVHSLCKLYQALIVHGVPADRIGFKHSLRDAEVASTGDKEFLYQLVTHARVRGGFDFGLFGEYRGEPRALCVYDETLWRSDTSSMRADDARAAIAWVQAYNPPQQLSTYLLRCGKCIEAASKDAPQWTSGIPLDLPAVVEDQVEAWLEWINTSGLFVKGAADDLVLLLRLAGESLRVLCTEQGAGVIAIRQAIPEGLRNVAILDASAPIRELAKLDRSITVASDFDGMTLKSFENVEVFQYLSGGGRSTLAKHGMSTNRELSALSREVLNIINQDLANHGDRCFLIFTYMKRGKDDPPRRIRSDLKAAGIDIDALTPDRKRRFEFLTWGQHEGLNGYEHCESVILAGVIQRDHLSLAAAIKGQQDDPAAATPNSLVRDLVESEAAHCLYQAASRGSCRRINNGMAQAMRLHVIHRHEGLKTFLEPVMPDAQWTCLAPLFLPRAVKTGKTASMISMLLRYLETVAPEVRRLSSKKIKSELGLILPPYPRTRSMRNVARPHRAGLRAVDIA